MLLWVLVAALLGSAVGDVSICDICNLTADASDEFFYVDRPVVGAPYPSLEPVPVQAILTDTPGIFTCRTVSAGTTTANVFSRPGFHSGSDMITQIALPTTATTYTHAFDDPRGYECATAWNRLFGGVRCGFLNTDNLDSDRFVWRRHASCVNASSTPIPSGNITANATAGGVYVNYINPCIYTGMAQIAAYAFDNGSPPTIGGGGLVVFDTVLTPEVIYTLHLQFSAEGTLYELLGGDGVTMLESHWIVHTHCDDFTLGRNLDLSLGVTANGSCPAPQDMDVCYSAEAASWGTEVWRRQHIV